MSNVSVKNIIARTYGDRVRETRILAENVYPGQLVQLNSSDEFELHTHAGGPAVPIVLDFDFGQGKDVDEVVASGNQGFGFVPRRGEEAYVLVDHDENIAIGDFLQSNGDGYFSEQAVDQESSTGYEGGTVLAVAKEAVNVTDSSGAETWNDYFCHVMFV